MDSQTDNISGEQVVYAYDALNRLASAGATSGTWGQSYSYDGFGNLQNQTVTAGSAPSLSVVYNASNNRQTTDCADANGNIFGNIAGGGSCGSISPSYSYDVTNRIVSVAGGVQYGYAPGNKRVWKGISAYNSNTGAVNLTQDTITFWSVTGQKLGDYNITADPSVVYSWNNYNNYPTPAITFALATANYYFGGKQIAKVYWQVPWSQTWPFANTVTYVGSDRLGSFGKYYPWGQEKPSATANNTEKFTGYFRDAETGLDYADQRYHQPGMGRFLTPDPSWGSGRTAIPGSWNRYAYAAGDPIRYADPRGRDKVDCDDADDCGCDADFCADGYGDGGGGGGGTCDPCDPIDDCFDPSAVGCGGVSWNDRGGPPVSDQDRLRDLLWMQRGFKSLTNFSIPNIQCATDLAAFGLTAADIDQVASNTKPVNYSSLAPSLQENFDPGADFTAVMNQQNGATFIVYNQNNFWQGSYSEMLGTLLHELIHLSSAANYDLSDTQIQTLLLLTPNAGNTSNISDKLAQDCFSNAKP